MHNVRLSSRICTALALGVTALCACSGDRETTQGQTAETVSGLSGPNPNAASAYSRGREWVRNHEFVSAAWGGPRDASDSAQYWNAGFQGSFQDVVPKLEDARTRGKTRLFYQNGGSSDEFHANLAALPEVARNLLVFPWDDNIETPANWSEMRARASYARSNYPQSPIVATFPLLSLKRDSTDKPPTDPACLGNHPMTSGEYFAEGDARCIMNNTPFDIMMNTKYAWASGTPFELMNDSDALGGGVWHNLQFMAQESKDRGVPWYAAIAAYGENGVVRFPTSSEFYKNVFTNLAAGAKGFNYFAWILTGGKCAHATDAGVCDVFSYANGIMGSTNDPAPAQRNPGYNIVADVNQHELATWGKVLRFLDLQRYGIALSNPSRALPDHIDRWVPNPFASSASALQGVTVDAPLDVALLPNSSPADVMVGQFAEPNGFEYLMLVNLYSGWGNVSNDPLDQKPYQFLDDTSGAGVGGLTHDTCVTIKFDSTVSTIYRLNPETGASDAIAIPTHAWKVGTVSGSGASQRCTGGIPGGKALFISPHPFDFPRFRAKAAAAGSATEFQPVLTLNSGASSTTDSIVAYDVNVADERTGGAPSGIRVRSGVVGGPPRHNSGWLAYAPNAHGVWSLGCATNEDWSLDKRYYVSVEFSDGAGHVSQPWYQEIALLSSPPPSHCVVARQVAVTKTRILPSQIKSSLSGADAACRSSFGCRFKAMMVNGNGRIASRAPLSGNGQVDWVLGANTSYVRTDKQFVFATDDAALFGVLKAMPFI